jgi:hypothetical protein
MADQGSRDQFMSLFKEQAAPQAGSGDVERRQKWIKTMEGRAEKEATPWLDVGAQAITNIVPSAIKYGKDIYEAVTNPFETAQGLGQLTNAALIGITPDVIANWMYDPKKAKQAGAVGTAVANFYKDRYGSVENFKQSLARDPVGVMGDVSTVLGVTGGAAKLATAIPQVGAEGKVAALAKGIGTASEYTDPLLASGKLAAAGSSKVLGSLTGVGPATVEGAAKAGFEGDKNFLSGLRGTSGDQALENAKFNLNVMRENRNKDYRSGMVDIKNDKKVLDFSNIDSSLEKAIGQTQFKGEVIKEGAANALSKIQEKINNWKSKDPAEFHTPEGMDFLKQQIGDILEGIPYDQKSARSAVGGVYSSIKSTIDAQAPTYAKVMKDYSEASDALREIEKTFSLKPGASMDTAMRKLQSITRNNVNTNYGKRTTLAQQLEQEGGRPFISMLQGEAMNSKVARGLAGPVEGVTALSAALINPAFLAALPFQTPRLVGEGAYLAGQGARVGSAPFRATGVGAQDINTLGTLVRPQSGEEQSSMPFKTISLADLFRQSQNR